MIVLLERAVDASHIVDNSMAEKDVVHFATHDLKSFFDLRRNLVSIQEVYFVDLDPPIFNGIILSYVFVELLGVTAEYCQILDGFVRCVVVKHTDQFSAYCTGGSRDNNVLVSKRFLDKIEVITVSWCA